MIKKTISIHIRPLWKRESDESYHETPSYHDVTLSILGNDDTYALRTSGSSTTVSEASVAEIVVESAKAFDSAITALRTSNQIRGLSIISVVIDDKNNVNSLINDFSIDYDINFKEITAIKS